MGKLSKANSVPEGKKPPMRWGTNLKSADGGAPVPTVDKTLKDQAKEQAPKEKKDKRKEVLKMKEVMKRREEEAAAAAREKAADSSKDSATQNDGGKSQTRPSADCSKGEEDSTKLLSKEKDDVEGAPAECPSTTGEEGVAGEQVFSHRIVFHRTHDTIV